MQIITIRSVLRFLGHKLILESMEGKRSVEAGLLLSSGTPMS